MQAYAAAGERMPAVVEELVREYNRLNDIDLRTGKNSTLGKLPSSELCEQRIERIYPKADCAAERVVLGRGRYYERLLHIGGLCATRAAAPTTPPPAPTTRPFCTRARGPSCSSRPPAATMSRTRRLGPR